MRTSSIFLRGYQPILRAVRADARRPRDGPQLVLACHSRAISDGQARYPPDSHGQLHDPNELAVPRSSSMNASREYA
jgi:hypothetical protein